MIVLNGILGDALAFAFIVIILGAIFTFLYSISGQKRRDHQRIGRLRQCPTCDGTIFKMKTGACGVPQKKCQGCGTTFKPGDVTPRMTRVAPPIIMEQYDE